MNKTDLVAALATQANLPAVRAEVLRRLAMADYLRGRLREAESGLHEALRISQDSADRRGQAWALHNLAWVDTTLGEFAAANAAIARAARLFAELGDTNGRAWLRGTTAFARLLAGLHQVAEQLVEVERVLAERRGERGAGLDIGLDVVEELSHRGVGGALADDVEQMKREIAFLSQLSFSLANVMPGLAEERAALQLR